MQLKEQLADLGRVTIEQYIDFIEQAIKHYVICPYDIYNLISLFVTHQHRCKVYDVSAEFLLYETDIDPHRQIQQCINRVNAEIDWNLYPIRRGDIVCMFHSRFSIFDGTKLVTMYGLESRPCTTCSTQYETYCYCLPLIPEHFDILKEFYPGYWNYVPRMKMRTRIKLKQYLSQILSNLEIIEPYYDNFYTIEWSYFYYNEGLIMVYTFYYEHYIHFSIKQIICNYPRCRVHTINEIDKIDENDDSMIGHMEKYTSINRDYHLCLHK